MKRKYIKLLCTVMMSMPIILSACTSNQQGASVWKDNEKIAYDTCAQIIAAIQQYDHAKFEALFSPAAQNEDDILDQEIVALFEFIQGEIVCFSNVSVISDYTKNHDARTTTMKTSFHIETSTNIYYMAFKECVVDTQNPQNIGISSLYIVDAAVWDSEYVYGGADRQWMPGIHIDTVACPY